MILPKERDPRFITIRRGGTLTDADHQLLALWAATCAEHVLDIFESVQPDDARPRLAIEQARAWSRGEVAMSAARTSAGKANAAARDLRGAPRFAAYAAAQAAAVAHVAAHELGAAAYAIKAAKAAAPEGESEAAGWRECRWQRDQLPDAIRELVLDDQRLRNSICWYAFDCDEVPHEVLAPITSLLSKSEKSQQRVAPGTWQHTMLHENILALRIGSKLITDGPESADELGRDDLEAAAVALSSMIERTVDAEAKFAIGTSQHTLLKNRLNALRVAQQLTLAAMERR